MKKKGFIHYLQSFTWAHLLEPLHSMSIHSSIIQTSFSLHKLNVFIVYNTALMYNKFFVVTVPNIMLVIILIFVFVICLKIFRSKIHFCPCFFLWYILYILQLHISHFPFSFFFIFYLFCSFLLFYANFIDLYKIKERNRINKI